MTNPSETRDSELAARLRSEAENARVGFDAGAEESIIPLLKRAADTIDRLTSSGEAYGWVFQDSLDPSREPLFTHKPYVAEVWRNAHGTVTPVYASPREGRVEVPDGMVLVPREPLEELSRLNDVIMDLARSGADASVMEEELGEATAIVVKTYRRARNQGETRP